MARLTNTLILLATTLSALVSAAPTLLTRQDPAEVQFTPFAFFCEMSQNPFSTDKPVSYNLTSSTGCQTPPYAFISYVEGANELALEACSVSLYSGPDCTGSVSAALLSNGNTCQIPPSQSFQSVNMACGP